MDKLIVTVAPTGADVPPDANPNLPITPQQIIDDVVASYKAGAAIAHIHVREPGTGKPSTDLKLYRQVAEAVKSKCDVILNFTTGAGVESTKDERIAVVPELSPEMATINMGSINFFSPAYPELYNYIFPNTFEDIEYFCKVFQKSDTHPELELYDTSFVGNTKFMVNRGALKPEKLHLGFVMGVIGGIEATPEMLLTMKNEALKAFPDCVWTCIALGRHEMPLNALAIAAGGHVRVGMEDNLFLKYHVLAKSNAELVAKVVRIAEELGRDIASPDEARKMLGLKGLNKVNF